MARGGVTKSSGNKCQIQGSAPVYTAFTVLSYRSYVIDSYSAMLWSLVKKIVKTKPLYKKSDPTGQI